MSYRILVFLKCRMTNAINCNCGFARDGNLKRGNTIDISCSILEATTRHNIQHIFKCNKCNTLAVDGDIEKRLSGYYSQLFNQTNRKSNYVCTRKTLKEKYLRYP